MTDDTVTESAAPATRGRETSNMDWTRVEGVLGVGALLTSFIWFLGMPTGMAIGVGFGIVLVLDVIRALILGSSQPDRSDVSITEFARH